METEREIYKHDSFGSIQIHKIFGKSGYMFGSDVNNDSYLELEVSNADMVDDPSTGLRNVFSRETILKVKFTASQFATLMTTISNGEGTPCTITEVGGERIPQVSVNNVPNKIDAIRSSYIKRVSELESVTKLYKKEIDSILSKKTALNETEKRRVSILYDQISQEFTSNIPFALDIINEASENIVSHAKTEVEAFVNNAIHKTGLDALSEIRLKSLESK